MHTVQQIVHRPELFPSSTRTSRAGRPLVETGQYCSTCEGDEKVCGCEEWEGEWCVYVGVYGGGGGGGGVEEEWIWIEGDQLKRISLHPLTNCN